MTQRSVQGEGTKRIQNDLLKMTDGCVDGGAPPSADNNDWITDCPTQDVVYPLILQPIEYVNKLI